MKRILSVEDDYIQAKFLETILGSAGIVVDRAACPLEAIDKVIHNKYDAILIDFKLPLMDAPSLVREIRDQIDSTCPIYIMSLHTEEDVREKMAFGMAKFDGFISKTRLKDDIQKLLAVHV